MATVYTTYDGVCTAAIRCVSAVCHVLSQVFTCARGGERPDEDVVAEGAAELEKGFVKLSVEETEPAASQSSLRLDITPFFILVEFIPRVAPQNSL
ncbi:hypothetical protein Q7C36_018872 [Tachysurus vachellii]|uniref:Uncharacterized protein n=1 Tax=Tachysurus vachellii TaxID=175792 RepID=A0AA88LVF6_TACVA|nr:hypothetical protein Q7C36_018872 [Tachysurus vachellii]